MDTRAWTFQPVEPCMRSDLRSGGRGKASRGAIRVTYNVGARVHVPAPREQDPEGRARAEKAAKRFNLINTHGQRNRNSARGLHCASQPEELLRPSARPGTSRRAPKTPRSAKGRRQITRRRCRAPERAYQRAHESREKGRGERLYFE
jgi:hypothetical protein